MNQNDRTELIREYPVSLWVIGFLFFAGGIYFYFRESQLPILIVGVVIGLLLVIFSTVLVVELIDGDRTLFIKRTGLVKRSVQELEVQDVQTIFVEQSRNRDRDSSATYRVVIGMKNGEVVPLRSYYSGGYLTKERTAKRLRDTIGVVGQDQTPAGVIDMASQMVRDAYQVDGKPLDQMEEQETSGVRWQIQTITFGTTPITRWLSKDFIVEDHFLYMVQKLEGQEGGKMVLTLMGKTLMGKSLQLYGFKEEDIPNIDNAEVLNKLDRRLDNHFLGYSSDEAWVQQILNAWVVTPLVRWAEDHPLRRGVKQPEDFNQLAVLISPNGVYISCLGKLDELETEQLINLGVDVVRALGG